MKNLVMILTPETINKNFKQFFYYFNNSKCIFLSNYQNIKQKASCQTLFSCRNWGFRRNPINTTKSITAIRVAVSSFQCDVFTDWILSKNYISCNFRFHLFTLNLHYQQVHPKRNRIISSAAE